MFKKEQATEMAWAEVSRREIEEALIRMGLAAEGEAVVLTALTGGVSSAIFLAQIGRVSVCVKRALAVLQVAERWEAPRERNAAEADYLAFAHAHRPGSVPRLRGRDPQSQMFAMDYLPPQTHPIWKQALLAGRVDAQFAASVGATLGSIHRLSSSDTTLASQFGHDAHFVSLRIDPYLRATGRRHGDLAPRLEALAELTLSVKDALVHGDVSPKNILMGPNGPILLDAECAWYGDPAFDFAFCQTHLLLKAVHLPARREPLLAASAALEDAYVKAAEADQAIIARAAALTPALLLARVDGKSPVEYLDLSAQAAVRARARQLLLDPAPTFDALRDRWRKDTP